MTDFVSNEELTAEFGLDYDPLCSQLTYNATILNDNAQILKRQRKYLFKVKFN